MTDENAEIDNDLIPETQNHSRFFGYMAGVGVTSFLIGLMGLIQLPPSNRSLAVGGGMLSLVVVSWVIFYD